MKTMIVTGASSGIGRALAMRAARAGYAVHAVGRNRDALDALAAKVAAEGGIIAIDATDVGDPAHARGIVERARTRFGSVDVLVNNAGFVSAGPIVAQADTELTRQFGTHVVGPLALVREALSALRDARGHVFMLGSGVARIPLGGLGAYPPAKAALRSATAILRRELTPLGIAVTYVDPGAVDTAFMKRAGMPGAPAALLASPEGVARTILIAVAKRPAVLNAVPWQTTAVALAERFPRITEALLARVPALTGGAPAAPPLERAPDRQTPSAAETVIAAQPAVDPADAIPGGPARATFAAALEPHRRRMEKLTFRESFVRELLVPGAILDVGEIALRWAGMPNKHERAVTEDVLEALVGAGFLERAPDHAYRVLRAPDATDAADAPAPDAR